MNANDRSALIRLASSSEPNSKLWIDWINRGSDAENRKRRKLTFIYIMSHIDYSLRSGEKSYKRALELVDGPFGHPPDRMKNEIHEKARLLHGNGWKIP